QRLVILLGRLPNCRLNSKICQPSLMVWVFVCRVDSASYCSSLLALIAESTLPHISLRSETRLANRQLGRTKIWYAPILRYGYMDFLYRLASSISPSSIRTTSKFLASSRFTTHITRSDSRMESALTIL